MLTYFMYCRKSSEDEERQIISNQSQQDELNPIANRDGLIVRDRLTEEASAKNSGTRRWFNEMIARLRKGEANGILCWHVNRLSRNAGDAAALVELMDQGILQEIRTPSQVFKNTPADKFLIILFCGQAKLENDNKGVDVERGLRKKVNMGWYPGVAPIGYLNDKSKNRGERDLYRDPERFDLVKRMWQMVLTGSYTPSQILRVADEEWGFRTRRTRKMGGGPLSLSTLYHVFHNPFYYGWFEYPKGSQNWYEGKHAPMISKEEFDRVQALLGRAGIPRPSKHRAFAFTGLIRCGECEGMITAEEKHQVICPECRLKFAYANRDKCPRCETPVANMRNPLFLHYTYYHCAKRKTKCRQPSLKFLELDGQIHDQLGRIQISSELKEWAFDCLHELHAEEVRSSQQIARSREKALTQCLQRIESLVKLKTSPENHDGSLLSDEEYGEQRRKLLEEKNRLRIPGNATEADQALERAKAAFELAGSIQKKFLEGDFQMKKQILSTVSSNLTLRDKKVRFEAKKPFSFFEDFKFVPDGEFTPLEPTDNGPTERRKGLAKGRFSSVLRGLKDVRTLRDRTIQPVKCIYDFLRNRSLDDDNPWIWN